MTTTRRDLLIKGSMLSAAAALAHPAWAAEPIKLGSLLDTSGNFDAYGKP